MTSEPTASYDCEPAYEVLDPTGVSIRSREAPLAERSSSLVGKTVFCISQFVGGADALLSKIAAALPQRLPGVRAVYLRKESTYMADDPALWERIGREGHAVIYGCAA